MSVIHSVPDTGQNLPDATHGVVWKPSSRDCFLLSFTLALGRWSRILLGRRDSIYSVSVLSSRKLDNPKDLDLILITSPSKELRRVWHIGTISFLWKTRSEYGKPEMLLNARH